MLKYQFFPRSVGISEEIKNVVKCFELVYDEIKSPENNLDSDGVLKKISPYLQALNFQVEISKKKKIKSRFQFFLVLIIKLTNILVQTH
ncbi:hypothetical protein [Runella sp.]|jgi:hypothetical protein|uniref:hypothetical protein n=1 Tax=Runella sp. TaxID=1960881 RepID=UPI002624EC4C|nr:hypothetical protein [Runella sp.]